MTNVIIDYGLGNLRSLLGALEKIGAKAIISCDHNEIKSATKLFLPGVGAFGDGMKNLRERGLVALLNELVLKQRKPILGICLGAQLLARESFEFGEHQGLGWIDASVKRLEPPNNLRVPHVGWNELKQERSSVLFRDLPLDALFYYVHSFHIDCCNGDDIIATCDYGQRFVASFERGNIFGVQFHPEKSQSHGLALLKNFVEYA